MIDKDTSVTAKGATHKSLALKQDGKSTVLTDFVKTGDTVTVDYHDMCSRKGSESTPMPSTWPQTARAPFFKSARPTTTLWCST